MNEGDAGVPGLPFTRAVVGLDGSAAALAAGRQIPFVAGPDARIWAVSCWDPGTAMHAGLHAGAVARDLRQNSVAALEEARGLLKPFESVLIRGSEVAGLLSLTDDIEADLIAIGSSGLNRAIGLVSGSVAYAVSRHAPCSVLVAVPATRASGPVIVASDGSVGAMVAASSAALIAAREGLELIVAYAGDEGGRAAETAAAAADDLEISERSLKGDPAGAVIELAEEEGARLIAVGARGRRGLRALGSVSGRIADRAPCSTLIVRPSAYPVRDD